MSNQGPAVILDNVVRSREDSRDAAIVWSNLFGSDVTSVGNTFTVASAVRSGRLTALDDRVVPRASLNPDELRLPEHAGEPRSRCFRGSARCGRPSDPAGDRHGGRSSRCTSCRPHSVWNIFGRQNAHRARRRPAADRRRLHDHLEVGRRRKGAGYQTPRSKQVIIARDSVRWGKPGGRRGRGERRPDGWARVSAAGAASVRPADRPVGRAASTRRTCSSRTSGTPTRLTPPRWSFEGGPLASSGRQTAGRMSVFSGASAGNRISYDVSGRRPPAGAGCLV